MASEVTVNDAVSEGPSYYNISDIGCFTYDDAKGAFFSAEDSKFVASEVAVYEAVSDGADTYSRACCAARALTGV